MSTKRNIFARRHEPTWKYCTRVVVNNLPLHQLGGMFIGIVLAAAIVFNI